MRTLKELQHKGYFETNSTSWASLTFGRDQLHKIRYGNGYVYYDGYCFYSNCYDKNSKIDERITTFKSLAEGNRFKLLSVVKNEDGYKNYLGKCLKTGDLITFNQNQIKLLKSIN
jgi:predicted glycosyl hydrolase (DUF1957 family)